jgi:hypothetical protein
MEKPTRSDVTISKSELMEKVCNCEKCDNIRQYTQTEKQERRLDESCPKYIPRLLEAFPMGEPVEGDHGKLYPIMGGYIPCKVVDAYSDSIIRRLNDLSAKERREHKRDYIFRNKDCYRPLYMSDLLEGERRQLHNAILNNAGFSFMETTTEATAFKIVVENHIENRARRMGLI